MTVQQMLEDNMFTIYDGTNKPSKNTLVFCIDSKDALRGSQGTVQQFSWKRVYAFMEMKKRSQSHTQK
jgi:hypothetical protein